MAPRIPLDMAALRRKIAAGGGYGGGSGGRAAASHASTATATTRTTTVTSTTPAALTEAPAYAVLADEDPAAGDLDPADQIDDEIIESDRWMDTEIAVGAVVAILLMAALVAVWISCKRRRRLRDADESQAHGESAAPAEGTVVHQLQTAHEAKKKQLNRMNTFSFKPPKLQVKVEGPLADANGNGLPAPRVTTIILPSTPSPDLSPNPDGSPGANGAHSAVGPWEPYFLGVGLPPKKRTRARRRSVSLRSGDDEGSSDADSSLSATPSRGPSPSLGRASRASGEGDDDGGGGGGGGDDAEPAVRKRSVTFNNMVEEVQILVR